MSDLRAQLDAEMGDPPRSSVDVDRIVGRQRRAGRLRIAGAAGLTAVVLAGTVAGALAVAGDPAPGPTPPAAAPTTATTTAGGSLTPPTATPPPVCPDAKLQPLTATLRTALRAEIGQPRLFPFKDEEGRTRQPLEFYGGPCDVPPFRNSYTAIAMFGNQDSSPLLAVDLDSEPGGGPCTDPDQPACTVSTGPDGEVIRSITRHGNFQDRVQTYALVELTRTDGTTVQLFASTPGGPSGRPPLSVAQLIRIGLTPGLSLGG